MSDSHWSATRPDDARPFEMLREIYEQPDAIANTLQLYVDPHTQQFRADSLEACAEILRDVSSMTIVASGASRHAGMCGKVMIEALAGIPVHVEHASEFIHTKAVSAKDALVIAITQSGETADTVAALRAAGGQRLPTLCISNVVESTIAREAGGALYTNAGEERAIPATKTFTSQLAVLYVFALMIGFVRRAITPERLLAEVFAIRAVPSILARALPSFDEQARAAARHLADGRPVILAGRGIHYPIALEAALKLKEIAYVHAQGYPTGELRHGITALIDQKQPLIMIMTRDTRDPDSMLRYHKSIALIRELQAHSCTLILVASDGDPDARHLSKLCLTVPHVDELLTPMLEIVPLQLLAYHIAVGKGFDVDHPRNLVKSVTTD